ncbi:tetratricopeptide repeat protein [Methylotuvimicrobium sp. KM1]|uniref:tetratricopeptide repeat protein n=1 Tax=Methylotuvimicrobium sp. KM1 TaxID=3377707 RepID=UPI00384F5F13
MSEQNTISKLQTQNNKNDEKAQLRLALERYVNLRKDDEEGADENHAIALNWLQNAAEEGLAEAQLALGILSLIALQPAFGREDFHSTILHNFFIYKTPTLVTFKKILIFEEYDSLDATEIVRIIAHWRIKRHLRNDKSFDHKHLSSSPEQPFHWLNKAAEQECAEAQYWLGYLYFDGIGIQQNKTLAVEWFGKAAAHHFAAAQYRLASCYHHGDGVEKNDRNAFFWANKVVEQTESFFDSNPEQEPDYSLGIIEAYLLLSKLYALGNGVEQNSERAYQCFKKVAEHWQDKSPTNDFLEGQFRSALFLLSQKNYDQGIEWISECVIHGYVEAADWLIEQYLSKFIPASLKEDEQSYRLLAEWCSDTSSDLQRVTPNLIMGLLYLTGKGVELNESLAYQRFNMAKAELGNLINEDISYDVVYVFLMICHALGKGVEKDSEKARKCRNEIYGVEFVEFLMDGLTPGLAYRCLDLSKELGLLKLNLLVRSNIKQAEAYFHVFFKEAKDFKGINIIDLGLRNICLTSIQQAVKLEEKNRELEAKNKKLQESEKGLEDMMAMFAHKFRSPLDAIIYNTEHENQPKLYAQAAQTMRGLLDVFSIISTDETVLKDRLMQDMSGNSGLMPVFDKTLNMILLHLLSVSGAEKIQQHYLSYANAHGLCGPDISRKAWKEEHLELERQLQTDWEQSYAALLNRSATLEQRLSWIEQHFFALELHGFDRADIQFKEYGVTESLLTILLNEILVNAFKYYSSTDRQPVRLVWTERDAHHWLSCRNPSVRNERTRQKGSGKGHVFLSALARKTGGQFSKPKPLDDFMLEFGIPNELLKTD